jgi:uncharacterized protein YcaQ
MISPASHVPSELSIPLSNALSSDEARRLLVRAQGLLGAPDRKSGVGGLIRSLGAVQLDTISVLARSHELVAYARLGAIGRPRVEAAYWGSDDTFEYWAHAACVLPLETWPLFAFRRRYYRDRQRLWAHHLASAADLVLKRVRADGPLTGTELGGSKKTTGWWGWSDIKRAAEFLVADGSLICARRIGWRRVYDLPERVIPVQLLHDDLVDDHCKAELIRRAGRSLGIGTAADLADYYRLAVRDVVRLLPNSGLTPVKVDGWTPTGWADPDALEALSSRPARGRHRTTLLSPFDSLVWDRKRTARVFGLDHRLEAYLPSDQRRHGYYTMPVLAGGQLVATVDPKRDGRTLIARNVVVGPRFATRGRAGATVAAIAGGIREAASWVGADAVVLERVEPAALVDPIRAAVS